MNCNVMRSPDQWLKAIRCTFMSCLLVGVVLSSAPGVWAAQNPGLAATPAAARPALVDLDGKAWHWPVAGSADKPLVLVFVATDCPIANGYLPQLQRMADERGKQGVSFLLVHPRRGVTVEAACEHVAEFSVRIPVVLDDNQSIARAAGATVTPQVAVFDGSSNGPVYRGRIDNLHAGFGKKRPEATSHDLADALDQLLAGRPVATPETEAIGCLIEEAEDKPPTAEGYDPLAAIDSGIRTVDLEFEDLERERRIPVRVYLGDSSNSPSPVVLFSHGLGGTRENPKFLGQHWAGRGYIAVFMQHPGSDDSVWRGVPLRERMEAMRSAASGKNMLLRIADVKAVIDQLEKWNEESGHPLLGRLDLARVGMSGHSFGAVTTQSVSGQSAFGRARGLDPRIRAAIAMSPSTPAVGDPDQAFAKVAIPWLLMTGTADTSILTSTTFEERLQVFEALPAAGFHYELVLHEAEHSVFSDRRLPGDRNSRNPNHHRAILAISTAFWDAHLKGDPAAREWLDGKGPATVLEEADRWQSK
jgi:predicted dienelactone hydrolase